MRGEKEGGREGERERERERICQELLLGSVALGEGSKARPAGWADGRALFTVTEQTSPATGKVRDPRPGT